MQRSVTSIALRRWHWSGIGCGQCQWQRGSSDSAHQNHQRIFTQSRILNTNTNTNTSIHQPTTPSFLTQTRSYTPLNQRQTRRMHSFCHNRVSAATASTTLCLSVAAQQRWISTTRANCDAAAPHTTHQPSKSQDATSDTQNPPSSSSHSPSPASLSSPFAFSNRDNDLSVPLPSLRYPIVLVHGYMGFDSLMTRPWNPRVPLLEYFGSVRQHLQESSGGRITVLTPVNPPTASIAARAKQLQMTLAIGQRGKMTERRVEQRKEDGTATVHHMQCEASDSGNGSGEASSSATTGSTKSADDEAQERMAVHEMSQSSSDNNHSRSSSRLSSFTSRLHIYPFRTGLRPGADGSGAAVLVDGKPVSISEYTGKFHLIAHSMGGLDCRYLISHLQPSDENRKGSKGNGCRVASLTTIGTPHRGSPFADHILDFIDVPFAFSPDPDVLQRAPTFHKFSRWVGGVLGLDVAGLSNLSTEAMKDFNARMKDHPHVVYQSYAGAKRFPVWNVWYTPSRIIRRFGEKHDHPIISNHGDGEPPIAWPNQDDPCAGGLLCPGGENDGLVSVGSARWGEFKGATSLDHLEQIGLGVWNKHLPLYRQIVFSLAEIEQQELDQERGTYTKLKQDQSTSPHQ